MIIDLGIKDGRTFKAEVLYTQIMYKHKRLEILFRIFRADENGEEVQNEFTKSWEKAFIANNETFVNSATGEYVEASTDGAIGEWDYFMYIHDNVSLVVKNLILSTVQKNIDRLLPQ